MNKNGSKHQKTEILINFRRHVLIDDVKKQRLGQMPGFKISWYHSVIELEPWAKYYENEFTKQAAAEQDPQLESCRKSVQHKWHQQRRPAAVCFVVND